jgi:hypothetical protein
MFTAFDSSEDISCNDAVDSCVVAAAGRSVDGEIVPQPPPHAFFYLARPKVHQISEM